MPTLVKCPTELTFALKTKGAGGSSCNSGHTIHKV